MEEGHIFNKQLHLRAGQESFYKKSNIYNGYKTLLMNYFVPLISLISVFLMILDGYDNLNIDSKVLAFIEDYWLIAILPFSTIGAVILGIILDNRISHYRTQGAKCQEKYDASEFALEKSDLIDYYDVHEDNLLCEYDAIILSNPKLEERIKEPWYSNELRQLPPYLYAFISIKYNFEYNQLLKSAYLKRIIKIAIIIFSMIFFYAIFFGGFTYVQTIYSLLPWFQFSIQNIIVHYNYNVKNKQIDKSMDTIYKKILNNDISEKDVCAFIRRLQDEVYKDRINAPFVPNYFYQKWNKSHKNIEVDLAKKYKKEIDESLKRNITPTN